MRRIGFHIAIGGLIGVLIRVVVIPNITAGMLLYYSGPGDPLWLDDMLLWGEIIPGAMLGVGAVLWVVGVMRQPPRVESVGEVAEVRE